MCGWDNIGEVIFMQDGAPPHFAVTVRAWLHQHFPRCSMARRGPHESPPRSPDLTPCDFHLRGYTKEQAYKTKPRTLDEFETQIQQVLDDTSHDVLQEVVHAIPGRLRKLGYATGACFEVQIFTLIFPRNKERVLYVFDKFVLGIWILLLIFNT